MPQIDSQITNLMGGSGDALRAMIREEMSIAKADTFTTSTGLNWYDLSHIVQLLYPFKELIPQISRLPRVPGDGGTAHNWLRITAVNVNNISLGVSQGQRGGRIAVTVQPQSSTYKFMGLESSVTFEARLSAMNLNPDALGNDIQSTLRSVMIGEEQSLILGNAALALGTTPTPTLVAGGSGSALTNVATYVVCVALSGFGLLNGSVANGIPGQITRTNADGSTDTYGGGSAAPSVEATVTPTAGQKITATVTAVTGAVGYAWYIGTTSGTDHLAAITTANQVILTKLNSGGQLSSALTGDNSQNTLLPDGILTQMVGNVFGVSPGQTMSTNTSLPANVTINSNSGSLIYTGATANTGLTIDGSNVIEFDAILRAAYDQYKIGYDRILMSASDIGYWTGAFLNSGSTSTPFMSIFQTDAKTGELVAGRRITSYMNKFFGNTLPIEVHPYVPAGTIIFWSDRPPYELSGVQNILAARTRMDYYQIQWPLVRRAYEFGVYLDEVFECTFPPAFGMITNIQPPTGTPSF